MKQSLKESLKTLSSKEIEEINKAQIAQSKKEAEEFLNAYKNGQCYLCALPFDEKNIAKPCVHWLLNQCDFQPSKDLLPIADHYGYFQIAAFLRWCANAEVKFRNINDLLDEKDARNVISNTIVWKDIEWTFACSAHDFTGHSTGTKEALKPHYHFQCEKCSKIYDLPVEITQRVKDNVSHSGFEVTKFTVMVSGICPNCKSEQKENE